MPTSRRALLQAAAAGALAAALPVTAARSLHHGVIPVSGERVAAIGLGTWLTFDVGDSRHALSVRTQILDEFFTRGGELIDSSPMYGSSQATLGRCLQELTPRPPLFAATKVWIPGRWLGVKQMEHSAMLWGVPRFDLLQVHNLLDWETHLETLFEWRESGRVRYVGVTTSHGRRHAELLGVLATQPLDFVQLTYNILDREAERELLPAAREAGIAVIANRPFRGSLLFDRVRGQPLPGWAAEIDCNNWAQVFLKFIISHPAVTCAIPATSRLDHLRENMGALGGRLPGADLRRTMAAHYAAL